MKRLAIARGTAEEATPARMGRAGVVDLSGSQVGCCVPGTELVGLWSVHGVEPLLINRTDLLNNGCLADSSGQ